MIIYKLFIVPDGLAASRLSSISSFLLVQLTKESHYKLYLQAVLEDGVFSLAIDFFSSFFSTHVLYRLLVKDH